MSRAVWKGPFVEESLMKKVEKIKNDPNKKPIKTWSKKSTIIPDFVGISFLIYNGKNLYQLLYQRTWLDIKLVNLHLLDSFLDILQRIRKQRQMKGKHLLKNRNYEKR